MKFAAQFFNWYFRFISHDITFGNDYDNGIAIVSADWVIVYCIYRSLVAVLSV